MHCCWMKLWMWILFGQWLLLWYVAIPVVIIGILWLLYTAPVIYSQEILVKAKWDLDQLCLDKKDV